MSASIPRMPQDKVEPSVVYIKISESGDYNMARDSGLGHMRMQIDSWARPGPGDPAGELGL